MKLPSKKKEDPARKGERRAAAFWSSRNLIAYPLLGGLISLAGVLIASLLIQVLVFGNGNQRLRSELVEAQAAQFERYANARVRALYEQLGRFASSDAVVDALARGDATRIRELEPALTELLESGLRVSVIPRGEARVDRTGAAPLNYAAKDMITRVEDGHTMLPEAFPHDGRNIVYGIRRVESDSGEVLGTVFAVLDAGYFTAPLVAFPSTEGYLRILQQFEGGEPLVVYEYGAAVPDSDATVRRSLSAEHWQLEFVPAPHLVGATIASPVILMVPIGVLFLAFVLGSFASYLFLHRRATADARELVAAVERIRMGRRGANEFALDLFERLAAAIANQRIDVPAETVPGLPPVRPPATAAAPPPAASAPPPTEDLVDLDDLLDIEVVEDDPDFLDISEDETLTGSAPPPTATVLQEEGPDVDPTIFRAYDIRGIVQTQLTEEVVERIGQAIGSEAAARGLERIVIACDGRLSSPALKRALGKGLTSTGRDVIDVGAVPTPLLYYATYALDTLSGVMITGSHNPPEYNGLKIMLGGETLAEGAITDLYRRIVENDVIQGMGRIETQDIVESYISRIVGDTAIAQSLKVVVDCGNGIAGGVAPALLEALGCEVVPLYCDVDGTFPNHHPDPADPHTLIDLITSVRAQSADLGIAFDGDGDRIGVVSDTGQIIWPDRLMMLFARDIVGRNPGADVIYDVKCSRHVNTIVSECGGRPIMWKTGHSHIKAKIQQTGALLGGEFSGHICFLERWFGFDDALYSAARLLEILGSDTRTATELFDEFPKTVNTPEIKITTTEQRKFEIIAALAEDADWDSGSVTTIDGVRVDFSDGWGLVRASNTSPVLTLRFEADDEAGLERIAALFRKRLQDVDASLDFAT